MATDNGMAIYEDGEARFAQYGKRVGGPTVEILYSQKDGQVIVKETVLPVRPYDGSEPPPHVVVEENADGSVRILSYPEGNLLLTVDIVASAMLAALASDV